MAKTKKFLTQRQAWLRMAKLWDNAKPDSDIGGWHSVGKLGYIGNVLMMIRRTGLCYTPELLPPIHPSARAAIARKIRAVVSHNNNGSYAWPTNAAGAKARAAFCRKQAELCK